MDKNTKTDAKEVDQMETIKKLESQMIDFGEKDRSEEDPDDKLEDLFSRLLINNYKLSIATEYFENRAEEVKKENEKDPKIEQLKIGKIELEHLKEIYEISKKETERLSTQHDDLKAELAQKRHLDENKEFYKNYREKFFPQLMRNIEKLTQISDRIKAKSDVIITEKEFNEVCEELERLTKENQRFEQVEATLKELSKENEKLECETCLTQVRNIEMEEEIKADSEYDLINDIANLKLKIKELSEGRQKNVDKFKDPNDFPALLDFITKCHKKKDVVDSKRKLQSPKSSPLKHKRSKTTGGSQHRSSKKRSSKKKLNVEAMEVPIDDGSMLRRTYGSRDLEKDFNEGAALHRTFSSRNLNEIPTCSRSLRRSPSFSGASIKPQNTGNDKKQPPKVSWPVIVEAPENVAETDVGEDFKDDEVETPRKFLLPEPKSDQASLRQTRSSSGKANKRKRQLENLDENVALQSVTDVPEAPKNSHQENEKRKTKRKTATTVVTRNRSKSSLMENPVEAEKAVVDVAVDVVAMDEMKNDGGIAVVLSSSRKPVENEAPMEIDENQQENIQPVEEIFESPGEKGTENASNRENLQQNDNDEMTDFALNGNNSEASLEGLFEVDMSKSLDNLMTSSPINFKTTSDNTSFEEFMKNDQFGLNKSDNEDFFGFDNDKNDDFFASTSFKSNEGTAADDFF